MSGPAEEVAALRQRAVDALAAADQLLAAGFGDFAAARAYYAAFYAASALLLHDGLGFSKHSAVIAHIHRNYVKEGRLSREMGKALNNLFDLRGVGDYGGAAHVTFEKAHDAVEKAKTFVAAIACLLPSEA